MVKNGSNLKKSDLIAILGNRASTSKEKNRAAKLLKKFDPNPHKEMDCNFDMRHIKINKYDNLQAYVCYRCDKVKQTNIKVQWNTPIGLKNVCNTCYANLCGMQELEKARRDNSIIAKANNTKI